MTNLENLNIDDFPNYKKHEKTTRLAPHGGCNWKGCSECFPQTYKEFLADQRLAQANRDGIEDSWYEEPDE